MDTGFYDVVLTAFNTSPLWREGLTSIVPAAKKHNVGVLLASPTQQGWLARRFDDEVNNGTPCLSPMRRKQFQEIYALCDETGIEIAVMCLRWALALEDISTVLTGPRNVEELEQNITAVEAGPLPEDVAKRLDEIAAAVPYRPFEEPSWCPFRDQEYWGPGPV